jgi:hypothetical protein
MAGPVTETRGTRKGARRRGQEAQEGRRLGNEETPVPRADLSCPAALKVFTPEVATGQSSGIPLPFFVRSSRWSVV